MDDFFSSGPPAETHTTHQNLDSFQEAIGRRFNTVDNALFTSRLNLQPPIPAPLTVSAARPTLTSGPLSQLSILSPPRRTNRARVSAKPGSLNPPSFEAPTSLHLTPNSHNMFYPSISPTALPPILDRAASVSASSSGTSSLLLIDIRSHNAFSNARIRSAINLSVPSTLLKRPTFSLSKLIDMIPLAADRSAVAAWRTTQKIVVYDADSTALIHGNNVLGLLRKFETEGFQGELGFLQGGYAAISKHLPDLVDRSSIPEPSDGDEKHIKGTLHARHLPISAFQQASTTKGGDNGTTGRTPHGGDASVGPMGMRAANPFYDNIRQNIELASGITERIPLQLPQWIIDRQVELPFDWLRDIVRKASVTTAGGTIGGESIEELAMQFYRIELGEQRRLQGVMKHHSKESVATPEEKDSISSLPFPYSITAGIEKGTKNRYRDIWPFEHARVRLQQPYDNDHSDYINASYVQPRGTSLKYIATQGPLAATFTDFWTLVWEQNVKIIVMLTKQMEGLTIKCGCYWNEERYGPFRLRIIDEQGPANYEPNISGAAAGSGGLFDFRQRKGDLIATEEEETIIRRTLFLSHASYPDIPPRKIVQLQYIGWPDLAVPRSPTQLLELVSQVRALRIEFGFSGMGLKDARNKKAETGPSPGPVLAHCSGGVGRTGSFVVVDAILDAIRRETTAKLLAQRPTMQSRSKSEDSAMASPSKDVERSRLVMTHSQEQVPLATSSDAGVVRLDADGHEVKSQDIRSVKKRRSSGGGLSTTGSGDAESFRSSLGLTLPTLPQSPIASLLRTPTHTPLPSTIPSTPEPVPVVVSPQSRATTSPSPYFAVGTRSPLSPASISPLGLSSSFDSTRTFLSTGSVSSLVPTSDASERSKPHSLVASPLPITNSDQKRQLGSPSQPIASNAAHLRVRHESNPSPSSSSANESVVSMDWDKEPSASSGTSFRTGISSMDERLASFELKKASLPLKKSSLAAASYPVGHMSSGEQPPPKEPQSPASSLFSVRQASRSLRSPHFSAEEPYAGPGKEDSKMGAQPSGSISSVSLTIPSTTVAGTASQWSISRPPSPPRHDSSRRTLGISPSDNRSLSSQANNASKRLRVPANTAAYDYTAPRKIRLPRDVRAGLAAIDGRATGPALAVPSTSASPIPIPSRRVTNTWLSGDHIDDEGSYGSMDESSSSTPSPLSGLDDPIRTVLEDMREQRMSLCQSLRQYVFVHLAIIEGTFGVVEEVRQEVAKLKSLDALKLPSNSGSFGGPVLRSPPKASDLFSLSSPHSLKSSPAPPRLSVQASSQSPPGETASVAPMEPGKADTKKSATLSKRPSSKRKQRSVESDSSNSDHRMAVDTP